MLRQETSSEEQRGTKFRESKLEAGKWSEINIRLESKANFCFCYKLHSFSHMLAGSKVTTCFHANLGNICRLLTFWRVSQNFNFDLCVQSGNSPTGHFSAVISPAGDFVCHPARKNVCRFSYEVLVYIVRS
jgi:hypothetical protein